MEMLHLGGLHTLCALNPSKRRVPRKRCLVSLRTQAPISRTQRIMEGISIGDEVGGAGGTSSYDSLKRLDQVWSNICSAPTYSYDYEQVVTNVRGKSVRSEWKGDDTVTFDIVVCGGTLGIFIAAALQARGLRVGVVEKNMIKGREQEWNISIKELQDLVDAGILLESDIEEVTSIQFNPNRCGFESLGEIWVENILNLGVSPAKLVEIIKNRFISMGGSSFEDCSLSSIKIYQDGATLQLKDEKTLLSSLVIDAMGNFSPVVKQIRRGKKPDGVCLVVGSCARGFTHNTTSDVIYSSSSVRKLKNVDAKYFWEAFPAGSGLSDRTTYMFTYVSPQSSSPQLEDLLEDYWDLMPKYQGVKLDDLEILRVLYGIFPTYQESPLPAAFDRVLQFGDAGGIQSPVSFGGFGSLTRHIGRLSNGIHEAISGDFLDAHSLSLLNPYLPNLSSSWLFQTAMLARRGSEVSPEFINELLYANFQCMERLGDPVLRPFLQDVIRFGPLVKTLALVMASKPQLLVPILKQVGISVLLNWCGHFFMLGWYTLFSIYLDPVISSLLPLLPARAMYQWRRRLESWKYGSGLDYKL